MRNVGRVVARDFTRIGRVPQAVVILIGLVIVPCLYAWFNIVGFWDPYSNTQNVNVSIVNLDEGASSSMTGAINVGDKVVAQLKTNHQLGWKFVGEDEGMSAVRSGRSYAAIVIPREFSRDLLSIATGHFVQPKLRYYVNEKVNAIAPKITGVGASTLNTQINSTFVSTVAEVATEKLKQAGDGANARLKDAQTHTTDALGDAVAQVASARQGLADLKGGLAGARTSLTDAQAALRHTDSTIGSVQQAVADAQRLATNAQQQLVSLTDSMTNAYVSGTTLLAQASAKLNGVVATVSSAAQQANADVGSATGDAQAAVAATGKAIAGLKTLQESLDPADPGYQTVTDAIDKLQSRNAADQKFLDELNGLNASVAGVTSAIQKSVGALNTALTGSMDSAGAIRNALMNSVPSLNREMSSLVASAGAFSSGLDAQHAMVGQALDLLGSLQTQLTGTDAALTSLDGNLADSQKGLETLRTDATALGAADVWNKVGTLTGLDAKQIAQFMDSPVTVKQHTLFPVSTYGSAMAPLFTNLALWIGAFVLVVLLKLEVDTEGVEGLTVRQAFLGRWLLLAVFAAAQAVLVSVGNMVIGVQMVNPAVFVATSFFASMVYLSIIYALSVSFGYIGKGIVILLVIMQIPGASGIYPIQMMPDFFQALFPFLPFTYGIDAMREVIGGFYGGAYVRSMAVLAVFGILAFILGLFLRQRLGNFARLFNRNVANSGLFVSEDVQILGSRRRLSDLVHALTNRDVYRQKMAARRVWFDAHHLTMLRATLIIGLAVTALLAVFASLFPDSRATVLGLWGLWCLIVIATLVTIEYVKQNIGYGTKVGEMSDAELERALAREEAATHSTAPLDAIGPQVEPQEAGK